MVRASAKLVWSEVRHTARLEMRRIRAEIGIKNATSGGFDGMSLGIALNAIWSATRDNDRIDLIRPLQSAVYRAMAGNREEYERASDLRFAELELKLLKKYVQYLKGEK